MAPTRITARDLHPLLVAILENQSVLNRKLDQLMSATDDLTAAVTSLGNTVQMVSTEIGAATQALSIANQSNDTVTIEAQVAKLNALNSTLGVSLAAMSALVPGADVPGTTTTTIVTPVSGQTSVPPLSQTADLPPASPPPPVAPTTTAIPSLSQTEVDGLSSTEVDSLPSTSVPPLSSTSVPPLSTTQADSLSTTSVPPLSSTGASSLSTTQASSLSSTGVPPLAATEVPPLSSSSAATPAGNPPVTGSVNTSSGGSSSSTS